MVVLPATNAEANRYFGPVHRSGFGALRRLDGGGWIQAGLWHFTTGRGGAKRWHKTVFAYGIHVFRGRKGANRALRDVKLKTSPTRIGRLWARRFAGSDARQTLVFLFFSYREILVEAYYEYGGTAPASISALLNRTFQLQVAHLVSVAQKLDGAIHTRPIATRLPAASATVTASPTATETATPTATALPVSSPTAPPTATPAPTATATSTPTATPIPGLTIQAETESPKFQPGSLVTVDIHASEGGQPAAGVTLTATFYFPNGPTNCDRVTDSSGNATCYTVVPQSTPAGARIDVTINAAAPDGQVSTTTIDFLVQ